MVGLAERATGHATALWALAVVAMVADACLTVFGLGRGRIEANPLAARVVVGVGPVTTMGLLWAGACAFGVSCWVASRGPTARSSRSASPFRGRARRW